MRRLEVVVAHMMARAHYQFYINIIILKTKRIRIAPFFHTKNLHLLQPKIELKILNRR
jgi:hypothetical protein